MPDSNQSNLENKIMARIKSGQVSLRSRYVFMAEKLSLGSAVVLSLLLAVLLAALVLYYFKTSDNLIYLSFGSRGLMAFLESFPYLTVAVTVILVLAAGYLVKRAEFSYRWPFKYLALGLVGFVILSGVALGAVGVGEKIEQESLRAGWAGGLFRPLLAPPYEGRRGLVGRVTEIGNDYLLVQTPRRVMRIDLSNLQATLPETIQEGIMVVAIGDRQEDSFAAKEIRLATPEDMPLIHHGIKRRFGPGDFTKREFTPAERDCLRNCFKQKAGWRDCRNSCLPMPPVAPKIFDMPVK